MPDIQPEEWRPLHPNAALLWRIQNLITGLILGGVVGGGIVLTSWRLSLWGALVTAVLLFVLIVAFFLYLAKRSYEVWRWALSEHDLATASGIWWKSRRYVPRVRIQHVDISAGPIARKLGIVVLRAYVAGGVGAAIELPGLTPSEAETLRQRLLDVSEEEIIALDQPKETASEPPLTP